MKIMEIDHFTVVKCFTKGWTIRKVMGGGGGEKNKKRIHARENTKKKNSSEEEGEEKKFMQKEGPIVTFIFNI